MTNKIFGKEFKKYMLPIIYKKCKTIQEFEQKEKDIRNMLIYETIHVYGNLTYPRACSFSYTDEKSHIRVAELTWDERDYLYKVFHNISMQKERAKTDWFFRPWKIKRY